MADPSGVHAPHSASKPPQFSMRTLLVLVTAAAIALALARHLGAWLFAWVFCLWAIVVTICLATLAAYCCGRRQTMYLGALAGALGALLAGPEPVATAGFALFQLAAATVGGAAAGFTRHWLDWRGWHERDRR
jgi:hypothetical protein